MSAEQWTPMHGAHYWGGGGVNGRLCECCTRAPTTHAPGFYTVCVPRSVHRLCLGEASAEQEPRSVFADAATCPSLSLHFEHPFVGNQVASDAVNFLAKH